MMYDKSILIKKIVEILNEGEIVSIATVDDNEVIIDNVDIANGISFSFRDKYMALLLKDRIIMNIDYDAIKDIF